MRFLFCFLLPILVQSQTPQIGKTEVVKLMGSRFEFTAVHTEEEICNNAIQAGITEARRIENLISSWDPNSQTSEIVRMAGREAVKVDIELFHLIERSLKVSEVTKGAFDISFASINPIWTFDGQEQEMPDSSLIQASVSRISYQNILLNPVDTSVYLKEQDMKIGFGAIGKGYAAARASRLMRKMGVRSGLVNAGGDLYAWGKDELANSWTIGVTDPVDKSKMLGWLEISDMAVVTSGDYERFLTIDGKRYAHIIDPRTGWPASGIKSVSIICPDPELADALATSVFVMGEEDGLHLINQLKGVECLLINDENDLISSDNLDLNFYNLKNEGQHVSKIGG